MPRDRSRRRVLALAGATALSVLGGCTTGTGSGSLPETTDSTPSASPTDRPDGTGPATSTGSTPGIASATSTGSTPGIASATSTGSTPGTAPDCSGFAVEASMDYESYDAARRDEGSDAGNSTRTPTTVELTRDYVVVAVTVEVADPPRLRGVIRKYDGERRAVTRGLERGRQEFRFGPFGHRGVSEYEFWVAGCRD